MEYLHPRLVVSLDLTLGVRPPILMVEVSQIFILNTLNLVSSLISSPPIQINTSPLWIIKPSQSSRGRGIYLIDDVSECPID